MVRNNFKSKFQSSGTIAKKYNYVFILLTFILLILGIIFGILFFSASTYKKSSESLMKKYAVDASTDALEYANKLTSAIQSDTGFNLAMVRQNIYLLSRLNDMSIQLSGHAKVLVPLDALKTINEDLEKYNKLLQTGTSSTMEIRTTLVNHLLSLQYLIGN